VATSRGETCAPAARLALALAVGLGLVLGCDREGGGGATPGAALAAAWAAVAPGPREAAPRPSVELPPVPANPDRPESWAEHYRAMARLGPGFVVWESRRTGSWRIWRRALDGGPAHQLSPDEPGRDHVAAHVSPDGRYVVYLSLPAPHTSFERLSPEVAAPLHLLRVDGIAEDHRVIAPSARTYYQSRAAVWTSPRSLIYIAADATTRELDVFTGEERLLVPKPTTKFGMLVSPTRTHATNGRPTFSLYFEADKVIAPRKVLPGCQPYFSPDGRFGYWVADNGGPVRKVDLVDGASSVVLERDSPLLPKGHGYVYYPMTSPDLRLLAFGASRNEHGHFDADFDVFVAPLDPETLTAAGTAVRYTFEPGQDRFPDVFVAGLELGRHRGEAPFDLTLHPDAGAGDAAGWVLDWGDGTPPGPAAAHRYERPGTYRVTARREGRTLGGEVRVVAGAPPRALRAEVRSGGREVAVVFDELVEAAGARARLESGAAVTGVARGDRGRDVVVTLAEPLAGADVLVLEGVADRASVAHVGEPARFPIEAPSWPGRSDGLAFVFQTEGAPNAARDVDTGRERAFNVTARGRARLDAHGALRTAGGWFEADDLPEGLAAAFRDADAFTLEVTVWPEHKSTPDPARIVSFGVPGKSPNFALSQHGQHAAIRLRTDARAEDKSASEVDFGQLEPGRPNHLLVSYRPGRLVAFQNGVRVTDSDEIRGGFAGWRDGAALALGADPDGARDFEGTIEGVALYARALDVEEAASKAHAYLALVADRSPIPRLRLKARLAGRSALPTPEQIAPYREALVLYEYDVPPKKRRKIGAERVRVAHWAILDGRVQPVAEPANGERVPLVLEPWEHHPRLESAYLADTLDPAPEIPLFLDVTN